MIDHCRLLELLVYDPDTGWLTSRVARGKIRIGDRVGVIRNAGDYRVVGVDWRQYLEHRLIWFYVTGEWPSEIDHVNLSKSDNRWSNLRTASRRENHWNTRAKRTSQTGIKGVYPVKTHGSKKYEASIRYGGAKCILGHFYTIEEAAAVRAEATSKHHGEFARTE